MVHLVRKLTDYEPSGGALKRDLQPVVDLRADL